MPEGPECRRYYDGWRKHCPGRVCTKAVIVGDTKVTQKWAALVNNLIGMTCLDIVIRGKRIAIIFLPAGAPNNPECYWILNGGYGMTGKVVYQDLSSPASVGSFTAGHQDLSFQVSQHELPIHTKFYLEFDHSIRMVHEEPRPFSVWKISDYQDFQKTFQAIGHDYLTYHYPVTYTNVVIPAWFTVSQEQLWQYFYAKITTCSKILCLFLNNQKDFCGIGNYLKSEIMYRSQLLPTRLCTSLTVEDIQRLFKIIVDTIAESYYYGGLSIRDYQDPYGNKGAFQYFVYKRETDPHGYKVIWTDDLDKQRTYYVLEMQR